MTQVQRSFYGATRLLDQIGEKLGIAGDLRDCFPDDYRRLLSIVYYLILGGSRAMMYFKHWALNHTHPRGEDISPQDSSRLIASISEESVRSLARLQGRRRPEREYWAHDSTGISSYSETLKQVRYGKNKEPDCLPRINLLLLLGEKSGLPFHYRKLSGSIPDVKTVSTLVKELDILGYGKVKFAMDRGFYGKANIDRLCRHHHKFIVAVGTGLSFARRRIAEARESIRDHGSHDSRYGIGCDSKTTEWECTQERPCKKDVISGSRRMCLHVYYSVQRAADEELELNARLDGLREELLSGRRADRHEKAYGRFLEVRETPRRGITVKIKEDAVRGARRLHGFSALVSNEVRDPIEALGTYRGKDIVEKAFGNLKERLNCRRLLASSEESPNGKLFVEFVALIYLAYINRKMREQGLYKEYTMEELLLELESIQSVCEPGRAPIVCEVLEKQRNLYAALDVMPPQ